MRFLKTSLLKIFLLLAISQISFAQKPKLIVVISYDQMRGDYIERWGNTWSKDGFLKIKNEGAYFKNCFFEHATNMTGPGHATLLTGCYPAKTGIVSNDFYEPSIDKIIYCCEDSTYGRSPRNMKTVTLGDMLLNNSTKSKVFSIALKDRAAILMAGQRPTGAIWFDAEKGEFTTSSYYQRPAWLNDFNDFQPMMQYTGLTWNAVIADSLAQFDAVKYEANFPGGTMMFPHALSKEPDSLLLEGYYLSPYSVDHIFQLANFTIEKEQLGADSLTDIFCIGVSTTDEVGHAFGPDSRELQELYVHCDKILGDFIEYLDEKVGRENYQIVITSDHGVGPIPELIAEPQHSRPGLDAGRLKGKDVKKAMNDYLNETFLKGKPEENWIQAFSPPNIFLNISAVRASMISQQKIVDSLKSFVTRQTGFGIAVGPLELMGDKCPAPLDSATCALIRNDVYPPRAGQLMTYPKPYWIYGSRPTAHGTPYDYDRFVPLMLFGGGIVPQVRKERVAPADIAPTLARELDIEMRDVHGRVLKIEKKVFKK